MKKSMYFILLVGIFVGLQILSPAARAAEIELKAVSYLPRDNRQNLLGVEWIRRINEGLKGEVTVKYLGGPEIIPSPQQIEAVRNNVVQIGLIPIALYRSFLEEANAFALSRYNPMEMRKSGFYDFLVKSHEKIGLRYIGPFHYGHFYLWLKKPIQNLDGFKGLKMRSNVTYDRFMKNLGVTPVTVQPSEVYTALERGIVDGFGFPLIGARDLGWTQAVKNIVDHPFYLVDLVILVNLDTWNKLPKSTRDKILEIQVKYEPYMVAACDRLHQDEWKALDKEGVKKITFSKAEADKYVSMAYQARWDELSEKVPKDVVAQLKKMTGN
jgi:TRAP-type C4-dicarboxylate transport system substrate-binding protein